MARLWRAIAGDAAVKDDKVWGVGVQGGASDGTSPANERTRQQSPGERARSSSSSFDRPRKPVTSSSNLSPEPEPTLTITELTTRFLAWLQRHRSEANHREAKRHLGRWCKAYGDLDAVSITGTHLEAFQDSLNADGHARMYVKKHATSVRAMYNKGIKMGWLPSGFRPFAHVEAIRLDSKVLHESDLPTDLEVKALLSNADAFMIDLIRVYHSTGARTHELISAKVSDFQFNARTIVLGKHKRSHTLREPLTRTITLNGDAFAILSRRCEGRPAEAYIFPNRQGVKPYTSVLVADRFVTVRKRAGVRDSITIYSFRHLWISEMLMAGVDVLLVARMAGTSVAMVERVYGHFRNQCYQDAQAKLDRERTTRGL